MRLDRPYRPSHARRMDVDLDELRELAQLLFPDDPARRARWLQAVLAGLQYGAPDDTGRDTGRLV
jgi:hypothetical protein